MQNDVVSRLVAAIREAEAADFDETAAALRLLLLDLEFENAVCDCGGVDLFARRPETTRCDLEAAALIHQSNDKMQDPAA